MAYPKKRDKEKSMYVWPEHEDPLKVSEVVEYHLMYSAQLSDFVEDTSELSDRVKHILYDKEDDKLGRIRDIYDSVIKHKAAWVEKNHDVNSEAEYLLNRATE